MSLWISSIVMIPLVAFCAPVFAAQIHGHLGVEGRGFFEPGVGSARRGIASLVAEPELVSRSDSGLTWVVRPFYRWDAEDQNRTHFDLRELALEVQKQTVDIRIGLRKVFWGVAESQHVADVINQTDLLESLDLEEKLGQPMINVNWRPSFASFEVYVLPYFREREFKRERTRFGPPLPVAGAEYENSDQRKHVDFAARTQFAPVNGLDVAVSHFYGTNREPQLRQRSTSSGPVLVPYYSIINQTGLELQWIQRNLALKGEIFYRAEDGTDTLRSVYGFEYTLFQLGGSKKDLGLIVEHNYDSQKGLALTALQNDLFVGARLSFNDAASSELIAGFFLDHHYGSMIGKMEYNYRLSEALTIGLKVYTFRELKPQEPLYVNRKDSVLEFRMRYHL